MGGRTRRTATQAQEAAGAQVPAEREAVQSNQAAAAVTEAPDDVPSFIGELTAGERMNNGTLTARVRDGGGQVNVGHRLLDEDGDRRLHTQVELRANREELRGGASAGWGTSRNPRSVSAWASARTGAGEAGGAGGGAIRYDNIGVQGQGGRTVRRSPPEMIRPGVYAVSGVVEVQGSAGLTRHFDDKRRVGGSAGGSTQQTYREVFEGADASARAQAFFGNPEAAPSVLPVSTLEAATQMLEGERSGFRSEIHAGLTGAAPAFLVAGGVSGEGSLGVQLERVEDGMLDISVTSTLGGEGDVGVSALGTGLGLELGREDASLSTWRIDPNHPDAAALFDAIVSGHPPEGLQGDGWVRTLARESATIDSGVTAEIFGQDLAGADQHLQETEETPRGRFTRDRWRNDEVGIATTSFQRRTFDLNPGVERKADEHAFSVGMTVRRDDLELSQEALEGDGFVPNRRRAGGAGDGEWTVESDYSEDQFTTFASGTVARDRPPGTLAPRHHGAWEQMQASLREDPADAEAVADFLQTAGSEGVRCFSDLAGPPAERFTSLADGSPFLGRKPSERMEEQVTSFEASGVDVGSLEEARALQQGLRARFDAMSAEGAFPDLPGPMRATEQLRLDAWMQRLDAVCRDLNSRRRAQRDPPDAASLERAEILMDEISAERPEEPEQAYRTLSTTVYETYDDVTALRERASSLWAEHNRVRDATGSSPREEYTSTARWWSGDGMEDGYAAMESELRAAEGLFGVAGDALHTASDDLSPDDMSVEGLQAYRNAQGFSRLGARQYEHIIQRLQKMRQRQQGLSPELWPQDPERR